MKKSHTLFMRSGAIALVAGTVLLSVAWTEGHLPVAHATYHSKEDLEQFRANRSYALDSTSNTYFAGSGHCNGCHGHDPLGMAMVTVDGVDVNVSDHWRSSMMANSARDPFWRAKVSHEVLTNPGHQEILENKCTSCHAPMGHFEHHMTGQGNYSIAYMEQDDIAFDGVSCTPCHMQSPVGIGKFFSGELHFDTDGRPIYGPYADDDIFGAPMEAFVNYSPQYGEHILSAGLCAGCHSLITQTADINGNLTGDEFVEQATYHEWLNSEFNDEEHPATGITCQGCHMPLLDDDIGVVLSANYGFLAPKSPFGQHHFAGANAFMLNMLKNYGDTLRTTASPAQFDSSIARTLVMLQQRTLLLDAAVVLRDADTAYIDVALTNLAGHKFPSGYPSRRAWVQLLVTNAAGDTLYNNGQPLANGEIAGHDNPWEPHYDHITAADQVQIYEMVMGDVNGNYTTVLERAKAPLKDNRLAPAGFSVNHSAYDTTMIVGGAATDPDFNHDGDGVEGSGTDIVHYHVPMGGHTGLINITATVWYQTAPPRYMEDMFTHSSPEIDLFKGMFQASDHAPLAVKSATLTDMSVGIDNLRELGVHIFPNPVSNGLLNVTGLDARVIGIDVYDAGGRKVAERKDNTGRTWTTRLPGTGTYFVVVRTEDRKFVEKVVGLR
ncbi:MAG TPA: T9SS type A sorting domain-containing protein [Flavobacteriales bacterium]|nr:T9SS type A sorting domain-containing protein [Flavobacteriales bacterium]